MKRADLLRANRLLRVVESLQYQLDSARSMKIVHFVGVAPAVGDQQQRACEIDLEDYPEPSLIGATYRAMRAALIQMFEGQLADAKRDLVDLGVEEDA
jgi:hypothetical protein